jgi:hypothetical protein
MPIDFVNSIYDSTELPYKKLIGKSNNDNDDQSRRRRTRVGFDDIQHNTTLAIGEGTLTRD